LINFAFCLNDVVFMKPDVVIVPQISPDQSVICILGGDAIPDNLALSKGEKEYARKRL
jgi:hypothetical protein